MRNNFLNDQSFFLIPYRSHSIDSSSLVPRYRVISSVCDIEITDSLYNFLCFISQRSGGKEKEVIQDYVRSSGLPSNKVEYMWDLFRKKGLIVNVPIQNGSKKEYRNKTRTFWLKIPLLKTNDSIWSCLGGFLLNPSVIVICLIFFLLTDVFFWLNIISKDNLVWSYYCVLDYIFLLFVGFLVTVFHEIGHIATAKHYGMKEGEIGIGMYYFFTVAYADVHGVWELSRKQRMVVAISGLYAQILLIPLLVIFGFLTRSAALRDFIILFHLNVLNNLNPFLKMDGYWLLSHYLGITSLHLRLKEYLLSFFFRKKNNPFSAYPQRVRVILFFYILFSIMAIIIFIVFCCWLIVQLIFINPEKFFLSPLHNLGERVPFSKGWIESFNHLFRNGLFIVSMIVITINASISGVRWFIQRLIKFKR